MSWWPLETSGEVRWMACDDDGSDSNQVSVMDGVGMARVPLELKLSGIAPIAWK